MFVVVPASMAFPFSPGSVAMPHPSCTLARIVVQHETRRKTTEQNTYIRQTLFCTLLIACRQTMMEALQVVMVGVLGSVSPRHANEQFCGPPFRKSLIRAKLPHDTASLTSNTRLVQAVEIWHCQPSQESLTAVRLPSQRLCSPSFAALCACRHPGCRGLVIGTRCARNGTPARTMRYFDGYRESNYRLCAPRRRLVLTTLGLDDKAVDR